MHSYNLKPQVLSLGWENPLEKEMASYSSRVIQITNHCLIVRRALQSVTVFHQPKLKFLLFLMYQLIVFQLLTDISSLS